MIGRTHAIARLALAAVFFYHGLVPKLLFDHPDEAAPLLDGGFSPEEAWRLVRAAGIGEILFAAVLLVAWRSAWPLIVTIVLMIVALVGVATTTPRLLVAAFNPVSLNLCVIALAAIDLLNLERRKR